MLARSPIEFADHGDIILTPIPGDQYKERPPYSMTSKGLCMEHFLIPFPSGPADQYLSLLNCKREGKPGNFAIPIRDPVFFQGRRAGRITGKLFHEENPKENAKRTLYIRQRQEVGQTTLQASLKILT